jgi:hypothetical protein
MQVVLLGDSRGYVPSWFRHGQQVRIVGFAEPFKDGESDHIIEVTDGKHEGWVKPSNIQRKRNEKPKGTRHDERHLGFRNRVHPAAAELLDGIHLAMPETDRASLPNDIGQYVDRIVGFALSRLEEFGDTLAESVARLYADSPHAERFVKDPIRSSAIVDAQLFLDRDGELISLKNPEVVWDTSLPPKLTILRYESYELLTGPLRGKRYLWQDAGALGDPVYKPGRASATTRSNGMTSGGPSPSVQPMKEKTIRIFLASSDELREDRDAFDLYFRQQNDRLRQEGLYLEIVRWENSLDAMSETRLQDEYNKLVKQADVFVALFRTKTGKFTEEEFSAAHEAFRQMGKPIIYTFFSEATVSLGKLKQADLETLWRFQERLRELGHFYTTYDSIEHLKRQFRDQLDKLRAAEKL